MLHNGKQEIFILLLCPYKVGSCYMSQILHNNNIPHIRLHSYDDLERSKFPTSSITHMITIERNPEDLYVSAYFADIDQKPAYDYSFGSKEDVTKASIQELVQFYFKQNWSIYRWLNFDYYRGWSRWFQKRGIPVLTLKTESLSTDLPKLLPSFIGMKKDSLQFDPKPSHVAKDGPDGSLYLNLQEAIRIGYQKRRTFSIG